jgi:hypothetical protein
VAARFVDPPGTPPLSGEGDFLPLGPFPDEGGSGSRQHRLMLRVPASRMFLKYKRNEAGEAVVCGLKPRRILLRGVPMQVECKSVFRTNPNLAFLATAIGI